MKIIDCHTHILNEKTLREYGREFDKILTIRFFKGFANGAFEGRDGELDSLLEAWDNLYVIEPIDFDKDIKAALRRLEKKIGKREKIKAVKLYTGYQHFYPQDKKLSDVYEFCGEHHLPVVYHSGALYEYKNSKALLKYAAPIHVDEVAARFPRNKFVISHLGFPYILETATVVSKNPNIYTDISGVIEQKSCYPFYLEDLKRITGYYPALADRLMFGTDFIGNDTSLNEVELYEKIVKEVFDEAQCQKVFYQNARSLYGFD